MKKSIKKILVVALSISMIAGCASSPEKIQTSYVSPYQYQNYDCDQIAVELDRVSRRTNELHALIEKKANLDVAQAAVGLVLFWPALFLLEGGNGPEAVEYARLKGEWEALEKAAIQKKCNIVMPPKPVSSQQTVKSTEDQSN